MVLRLEHEGTLLAIAGTLSSDALHKMNSTKRLTSTTGTESTAKSIAISHSHLLPNPSMMARLRAKLRTVPETATWTELEQLPYLSAVIRAMIYLLMLQHESFALHRMKLFSTTPIQYPSRTPLSMTTLCVHTNDKILPQPWEFNPDCWQGHEGTERRKHQMTFNKGGTNCASINLALSEMFLAIAAVACYNLELLETDIWDVEFRYELPCCLPKIELSRCQGYCAGKGSDGLNLTTDDHVLDTKCSRCLDPIHFLADQDPLPLSDVKQSLHEDETRC